MEIVIVLILIYLLYRFIIKPFQNGFKENKSIKLEIEDDDFRQDESIADSTTKCSVSANVSYELKEKLDNYCNKNNITKTKVIIKALDLYLSKETRKDNDIVGNKNSQKFFEEDGYTIEYCYQDQQK